MTSQWLVMSNRSRRLVGRYVDHGPEDYCSREFILHWAPESTRRLDVVSHLGVVFALGARQDRF